jgi:hypothetical protein
MAIRYSVFPFDAHVVSSNRIGLSPGKIPVPSLTSAGPVANDPRLVPHSIAFGIIIVEIGEVNSGSSREEASGHHFGAPRTFGTGGCECAERANYCRVRL